MPELPEVETVRRELAARLTGRTITAWTARLARMYEDGAAGGAGTASKSDASTSVRAVERRGKYLVIRTGAADWIVHLGMTGRLIVHEDGAPTETSPHLRFLWTLDRGTLAFHDARTFGRVIRTEPGKAALHPRLARLGPDAWEGGSAAWQQIRPIASKRTAPIKSLLLDQAVLTGIGNIYSDEALGQAAIHPERPANSLTDAEWRNLGRAVREALRRGLKADGTTFSDYRRPGGESGRGAARLRWYGRAGLPCLRCGAVLRKSVVAARGTVHCPVCQTNP